MSCALIEKSGRLLLAGAVALTAILVVGINAASAQDSASTARPASTLDGESYVPTTWIDPDGCEHWVMDDGFEGYMDIKLTRDGRPICHRAEACGEIGSDQLFATNSATIGPAGRARLQQIFNQPNVYGYMVYGHTDSRAGDAYNMRLSKRRADAVARVGQSLGANIVSTKGYGEREPVASNATAAGMQKNRRVEIICLKLKK